MLLLLELAVVVTSVKNKTATDWEDTAGHIFPFNLSCTNDTTSTQPNFSKSVSNIRNKILTQDEKISQSRQMTRKYGIYSFT